MSDQGTAFLENARRKAIERFLDLFFPSTAVAQDREKFKDLLLQGKMDHLRVEVATTTSREKVTVSEVLKRLAAEELTGTAKRIDEDT